MKKLITVLLTAVLLLTLAITAAAAEYPRLIDIGELLSDSQEEALLETLDAVSEKWNMDVVIITTDTLDGYSATQYADDLFDYMGYGMGSSRDGILLLISMEERDWAISTCGAGIRAFTDAGLDYISDLVVPCLSDGDYYGAFTQFADLCDDFIRQAKEGHPYDAGSLPAEPFDFGITLLICLGIGFLVALIATAIMKGQLKSVRAQSAAADYLKAGSLQVTESRDLFLYRNITRQPKPKSNNSGSSTHRSSSGSVHGGRSGKF